MPLLTVTSAFGISDYGDNAGVLLNSVIYTLSIRGHLEFLMVNTHTHAHTFNDPFSGTIRISRYQKGKPIWILLKQETVSGSGISWAIYTSAPLSTKPAPHHSVFLQAGCPTCRPTNSVKAL